MPADGATAFTAVYNRPVVVSNLGDIEELKRIAPDLVWGKTLAEDDGSYTRAFMSYPVTAPFNPGRVIGVLRTCRDANGQRTMYSRFETETFALFASLPGHARGRVPATLRSRRRALKVAALRAAAGENTSCLRPSK